MDLSLLFSLPFSIPSSKPHWRIVALSECEGGLKAVLDDSFKIVAISVVSKEVRRVLLTTVSRIVAILVVSEEV